MIEARIIWVLCVHGMGWDRMGQDKGVVSNKGRPTGIIGFA